MRRLHISMTYMLRMNPKGWMLVVRADLALYLGSKLKLKQEEGLNVKPEVYFCLNCNKKGKKIQIKEL